MRKRSTARRPSEPWRKYVVRKDGSRVRNECYSPKGVRHGTPMSSGSSEQVMGEVMAHSGGSSLVVPARTVPFPQGYKSLMSAQEKVVFARDVALEVEDLGYDVVASSVTGSRLRGTDHEDSDSDFLLLVSDKTKAFSFDRGEYEGQVQSLGSYLDKVSTSVPYMECLMSPFRVTDRRFAPVIDAVRPNITEFRYHADKFAMHLCARPAMKPEKRARNVLSTYLFRETVNPLMTRSVYEMTHPGKSDAADWLEEIHSIRGIDMNDETRDTVRILRSNG